MSLELLEKERARDKESWRYTSLAPYADLSLGPSARLEKPPELPPRAAPCRLVFVNGFYDVALSESDGLPEDFLRQEGEEVTLSLKEQTCLVLHPLEILFLNDCTQSSWQKETKLHVSLGENARLTLLERHMSRGAGHCLCEPSLSLSLAKQAKLVHGKIFSGSAASLHVGKTNVSVEEGAFYDHFSLITKEGLTRSLTKVCLKGELAGTRLSGANLLRGGAHADSLVEVVHEAPHGTSQQNYRAVLMDKARGIFQGKVYVDATAQKTDAHQLSRALLLSDRAEMDTKPELEIYADDVKCSHGSTVGDLNESEIFYLRSRGISEEQARALLIEAFVYEGAESLQSKEIAALAKEEVRIWLAQN